MNEETKQVEMYSYYVNGKELWTSNEVFANIRAKENNSKVYVETVNVKE
jgi:hypothetical protein